MLGPGLNFLRRLGGDDEKADLSSRTKEKRKRLEKGTSKRRKIEDGSAVWGESVTRGELSYRT